MALLKRRRRDEEEEEEKYTGKKNALRDTHTHTHTRECVVSIVSKFNTTLRLARRGGEKEDAGDDASTRGATL